MNIWNRLSLLRGLANTPRVAKAEALNQDPVSEVEMARRWSRARQGNPELLGDLIRLGGIMATQPMQDGEVLRLDAQRLAYEAGRRDFALQLTALMALSPTELNDLMEDFNA